MKKASGAMRESETRARPPVNSPELDIGRLTMAEARAEWVTGDREGSLKILEAWLARSPRDTTARLLAANFYLALDRQDAAQAMLSEVISYDPDNWLAHNDLAWLFQRSGNLDAGLRHAERAYELMPGNPAVMDTLACCHGHARGHFACRAQPRQGGGVAARRK